MTTRLIFHPEIEADIRNASAWYTARHAGLGSRFKDEFFVTVEHLHAWPLSHPVRFDSIRAAKMSRFPYLVFFAVEPYAIWVLAVHYAGRDPAWIRHATLTRRTKT